MVQDSDFTKVGRCRHGPNQHRVRPADRMATLASVRSLGQITLAGSPREDFQIEPIGMLEALPPAPGPRRLTCTARVVAAFDGERRMVP